MKKVILIFALFSVTSASSYAQTNLAITKEFLESLIAEGHTVENVLTREFIIKLVAVISTIVLGAIISLLQGLNKNNKSEINSAILVLGILITTIGSLNAALLRLDWTEIQLYKSKVVDNIHTMTRYLCLWEVEENRSIVREIVQANYDDIITIRDEFYQRQGKKIQPSALTYILSKVYAEELEPDWIRNLPKTDGYVFEIGASDGDDYKKVDALATKNGQAKIQQRILSSAIQNGFNNTYLNEIADEIGKRSQVVDRYSYIVDGRIKIFVLLKIATNSIPSYINSFQLKQNVLIPEINNLSRTLQAGEF